MLRSPEENDVWFTDEDSGVPVGVERAQYALQPGLKTLSMFGVETII